MNKDISKFTVRIDVSIRQAIEYLNQNAKGIVLVVDDDWRLLGTITDSDIRRAIAGAGAVVTRQVPAHTTVVGIPAKPIILKKAKPDIFFNTYSQGEK